MTYRSAPVSVLVRARDRRRWRSCAATGCAAKGTRPATPQAVSGRHAFPPRSGVAGGTGRAAAAITVQPAVVSLALCSPRDALPQRRQRPAGFDCSGFVQWVFAQHGLALPREVKRAVPRRPRDRRRRRQGGRSGVLRDRLASGASHVGIALGGGEFVHAPSSRGVVRVERYTSRVLGRPVGRRAARQASEPAS